jgi:nucleoside-diphosphate-sugar epimerase
LALQLKEDLAHILNHTRPVWEQVAGKTIFLTGGTGFFGKWLLESFIYANVTLQLNAKMIVLSRDPEAFLTRHANFKNTAIQFIKGDTRTFAYPDEEIDYIIHTATEAGGRIYAEKPLEMYDTITGGTKHVLELARLKEVKAILHTSSGAVYGKQPGDMPNMAEDHMGGPDVFDNNASYGEGKRVAEMYANIYYQQYGVPSKIARCFAFVGPYLPLDSYYAIGNFINDTIKGNKITIKGDGSPYRSYMYAADLTIWLWHILMTAQPCIPYNVGSDNGLTLEEVAKIVAACAAGASAEIEVLSPKNNLAPQRYVPSIKRAKEELNLKIHIGLEEAIKKTVDFYTR